MARREVGRVANVVMLASPRRRGNHLQEVQLKFREDAVAPTEFGDGGKDCTVVEQRGEAAKG